MFVKPEKRHYKFSELQQVAIRLLARREHSRLELFNKLQNYTEQLALIEQLLDYCCEHDYLSNQRYTDSYLRLRSAKGFGLKRIWQELKEKGITQQQLQSALVNEPQDWFALALKTYQKKYSRALPRDYLACQKESNKRYQFMLYRGFNREQIQYAIENSAQSE